MKINKEDIKINYSHSVIEEFSISDRECWALIIDGNSWFVERIIGFGKVIEHPCALQKNYANSTERVISWKPCYIEYNSLNAISDDQTYTLIFDKMPTQKDAEEVKKWIEDGYDAEYFKTPSGKFKK